MKYKIIFITLSCLTTLLLAENFVLDKKPQKASSLREDIAKNLMEIMKSSAQNHKLLAKIQKKALNEAYDLLVEGKKIDKNNLQEYLEDTEKIKKELERQNLFLKNNYKKIKPTY